MKYTSLDSARKSEHSNSNYLAIIVLFKGKGIIPKISYHLPTAL